MNAVAAALRVLVVGVLLVGALFTPPLGMLVLAPVVGVGAMVVHALVHWSCCDERWPAPRRLLDVAAAGAGLVPWTQGVRTLGEVGTVLGAVSVVLLGLLVLHPCTPAGAGPGVEQVPSGDDSTGALLALLPLDMLLAEWRAACAPSAPTGAAALRTRILDELSRRDPSGVQRWLDAGAAGPLEPHLRGRDRAG